MKTFGIIWQFCWDESALAANPITDFTVSNANTDLCKFKEKITGETCNDGTKNVEIRVPLKYFSNFGEPLKFLWLIVKLILI